MHDIAVKWLGWYFCMVETHFVLVILLRCLWFCR